MKHNSRRDLAGFGEERFYGESCVGSAGTEGKKVKSSGVKGKTKKN